MESQGRCAGYPLSRCESLLETHTRHTPEPKEIQRILLSRPSHWREADIRFQHQKFVSSHPRRKMNCSIWPSAAQRNPTAANGRFRVGRFHDFRDCSGAVRRWHLRARGRNRSRSKPHRCGVGVCGRGSPWLCCEPRQSASFTTGASPWGHQVKPSRHHVNA